MYYHQSRIIRKKPLKKATIRRLKVKKRNLKLRPTKLRAVGLHHLLKKPQRRFTLAERGTTSTRNQNTPLRNPMTRVCTPKKKNSPGNKQHFHDSQGIAYRGEKAKLHLKRALWSNRILITQSIVPCSHNSMQMLKKYSRSDKVRENKH